LEELADDEWFVVGVALVGGVSGKRIRKEGAEEQGRLCALERRRKARARRDQSPGDSCCFTQEEKRGGTGGLEKEEEKD